MALLSDAISFARSSAQTDSNGLTDATAIIFANEALVDFHRELINHSVDASQLQEAYTDASVPTAGNGSTFLYPADMLFLKAIEVNFTDTNPANYITAQQVDVSNLAGQKSFSYLRQYASTQNPQFDDRGDSYEIFPAFTSANNISQAIRLFYFLKPTEYTSVGDTIAYPENMDIRILGYKIAENYLLSLGKWIEAETFTQKYATRVKQYCATLARGAQQPIQATPLQITGYEF
jgi:hypothetical protein